MSKKICRKCNEEIKGEFAHISVFLNNGIHPKIIKMINSSKIFLCPECAGEVTMNALGLRSQEEQKPKEQPEIKLGLWTDIGGGYWECSECKGLMKGMWGRYCPNCGIKMKGRKNI